MNTSSFRRRFGFSSSSQNSSTNNQQKLPPNDQPSSQKDEDSKYNPTFECNICLETAKDAVVSMCGHLFCWPCLYQWLSTQNVSTQFHKTCPVCKAAITRDKVIPIYGRGGDETNRQDPRDKLPPRPSGQRTEVPNTNNTGPFSYENLWAQGPGGQFLGFGDGSFHLSSGVASIPHTLFNLIITFIHDFTTSHESINETEFYMMRFFMIIGVIFIIFSLTYM